MTDYLTLAQARAPRGTEEQDNPYLPLAQQQQNLQQNRARTVLESALRDDPDLAAERLRVSQTSGVPLRVVERNLDELRVKERARAIDLVSMAQDSPVLYRQIIDPTFATTSVDDLGTLKNLERSIGKGVRYVMGADGKGGLPSDLVDATKTVGLGATVGLGKMANDIFAVGADLMPGGDNAAAYFRNSARQQQGVIDKYGFQAESSTGEAVKSGLQSAGTNLALLPLGLYRGLYATANQAASTVAGLMASGVGASAFNEARDKGKNEAQALTYAIPQGAFEYVFERIPAAKLFGDLAANTGLLKLIGRQTLSEGWTEQVTTLAQDFNEWMNLNPDKTLGEFIQERPEAAYQTFIATLVGVGVQTTTIKGINKIVEAASDRSLRFDQDLLEQQMQLANQSMLRQRSPEQFRAHVQRVVEGNEGAKQEIYVDAEVLNQLPPELLAQLPESVREALPAALETNSTVAIPMADVLTVAPGTELEQILNDNARMRPNAASRVEAQLTEQYLQQEAERVLAQAADTQAWQQSSEQVKQAVLTQLNSTGRFTPDVNDAYATLQANFFSTMAARTGLTPQELYGRYSLKVAAKQVGQGGVLNADGGTLADVTAKWDAAGITGDVYENRGVITLSRIVVPEGQREQGTGTAALQALVDYADRTGQRVVLSPSADFGGNKKRLMEFYKRFGFVENKGRNKDFAVSETMIREPQQVLEQRGVQEKGKTVPTEVDATANVESAFEFAATRSFPNNRDFKLAIQARVVAAAKAAKVKLDEFTQGTEQYLVRLALADGLTALRTNANAVGWYNEKVTKALRLVSLIHPEIATDPQAKFAFVWAMAVTSNGLKVDKNFELAEKVYQGYKTTGQMPTDVGIGTAAEAINRSLGLYNTLIEKHGFDVVEKFMTTLQPAGEVEKFTGNKVTGENKTTQVYGAAALGPKIGNGFFMNLYGRFEQLTMDRWLMRTWGRWTGTLVEANPEQVKAKRTLLKGLIQSLTPADKKAFEAIIKRKLTVGDVDAVGQAIWKASQKPVNRKAMAVIAVADETTQARFTELLGEPKKGQERVSVGDELRKAGNALTKYLDGQKEAPSGPPERGNIRKVFAQVLGELQKTYPALTMSDLQALLWYPEKRLYDAAKTSDEATDGYEDDEAPDYANAAAKLARSQGIPDADIAAASAAVDAELQAAVGAAGVQRGQRGLGDSTGSAGQTDGVLNQSVAQTDTPEFQDWFGDSQVVDENGNPLVVYHGTNRSFDAFSLNFRTDDQGNDQFGPGYYTTTSATGASGYASGEGANVLPLFVSLQNPITEDTSAFDRDVIEQMITSAPDYENRILDFGTLEQAVDAYTNYDEAMLQLRVIENDFYPNAPQRFLDTANAVTGHDGVIVDNGGAGKFFIAWTPEQIKSATGNQGTFDAQDPNMLRQGPRGTFSPSQLLLTLNENADLSTFLHESGHFFLEVMADLASQPNAPQQIKDDMAATLAWFGVPDLATWNNYTLDEKRPYHERWAESFEQYLFEGKAPSPELQPLFRRFRSWMVNVYKSLTEFMRARNLKVNDEVRQVFGRLIATDEQIAQAEEAAGLLPDFDATNEAIEQLQARSLRDLKWTVRARGKVLKALEKEAKELRKGVEAEVRAEVEQQPLYKAMNWLKKGETTDPVTGDVVKAEKGYRLSTAALAEMYPDTMLARPDLTGLRGMTGKEGLHPDMVADMFGYETGDQLVRAILDAEPIASVIEGMTDQRMLERHGELATPEALEAAANEAVHNEARARSLATELKSQAEMLNPRQDTGRTASNGRPITVNAITAAAKQFAANLAARRRIKDLKNAAWQHRSAEARAGKAWQAATAKADTQAAVQAKRDQVLNNAAVKALQDAQVEVKKILEFFKRVTKGNDEKLVERGRDPDVVNAMRAILGAYDVAPRLEKTALAYMETVAKNDPVMYAALQPSVQGAMLNAKPLPEMTMEELRGLNDELRAMWSLAKSSRQMEVDGNLIDIEEAADQLVARMGEIGVPDTIPGETGAITDKQERGIKLQFAKAILSRVEQWSERLDGKFGGPFLRLVFQPVKDAADRYRTDKVAYRKKFTELLKNVAPALPAGPIEAPELGYTFGNARDSGAAELLHAILHTGNDSNKRKLLLGRGWATQDAEGNLDTTQWDAFIQRMQDEGKINKVHYDFAQGVWDLLEEMKPLAQDTHRKVFGRYFAEVTANEVVTPFGTYRGGYLPAQTDSRLVKDAKLRELAEGENESMAYAFPAAPSGFTKSRVEYNQPLLLDLRALGQHMDKVLLFSHMQGAVTDVRRLLTNKRVSYLLDRLDPGAYEGMLIPWLNRSARQVVETPVVGDRKLSRFLSAARSRAGMALMFANLSNTVQQITGFTLASVKVKPGLMMQATARFIADPKAMKTTVADSSPYMKDRMLNEVGAMNDAIEEILVDPTLLERGQAWTQRHGYFMQAAVDNTMSPIIWTAAYNQSIEQGMSDKDAVRFADGVIRQTQGTTLPEDISRFESGPGYARLFTQFVSYFNMMANTNATAVKQITDEMGLKKGAGKVLYVAIAGLLAPIWVAEAIAQAFRGGPEDEDKDGWLDDWLLAVFGLGTIRGLTAQIPIVGQAAQLVVNRFNDNPADDKFSLSPAISLIESTVSAPSSVYKAIVDDGNKQKAVRDVAAAATMITGLPIFGIARPLGYLAGVAGGDIEPTGPADLARGLVTGTASPESKQR
jgi:GNAT superfamily N-acetyltransferase